MIKTSEYLNYVDAKRTGFAEILNFIDNHLDQKLSIQTLAEQFGYNTSYFARKFASDFGITPAKYILQQRIVMSQNLLLGSNQTTEEIANAVGFYDASHLIAKFKESEGITPPHKYRRQNTGLSTRKPF